MFVTAVSVLFLIRNDLNYLRHYFRARTSVVDRPRGALVAQKGVRFSVFFYIVFFPFFVLCHSRRNFISVLTVLFWNKVVQATWAFVVSMKAPSPVQSKAWCWSLLLLVKSLDYLFNLWINVLERWPKRVVNSRRKAALDGKRKFTRKLLLFEKLISESRSRDAINSIIHGKNSWLVWT